MKKIYYIFMSRLKEFYRDRAALAWNFIFPFFTIIALFFVFRGGEQNIFKIAYSPNLIETKVLSELKELHTVKFFELDEEKALIKVKRHKVDAFVSLDQNVLSYYVNDSSPNGSFLDSFFQNSKWVVKKEIIKGKKIDYVDWLLPGILGMNIMFSCLWGVGYVIVKYRQDGYLKRLNTTPLNSFQFLTAQLAARYIITFAVSAIVFFGSKYLIGFEMNGSYWNLLLIYSLGVTSLSLIGLIVAARTTSKEFADGILNLFSWPMMMLSEVWFSLEDSSKVMQAFSDLLPLTHMVKAARAVMVDGASIFEIQSHLYYMAAMCVVFMVISVSIFKWSED